MPSIHPPWAEHDKVRLCLRLARVTRGELDRASVEELAAGDLKEIKHLSPAARYGVLDLLRPEATEARAEFESLTGDTRDFLPIAYLDLARLAASSVGRVAFRTGAAQGTGVLVSGRLLLTNNHVTETAEQARVQVVQFNYERDILSRPVPTTEFALDPAIFFVTSHRAQLDYTLVAVGERLSGPSALADFGSRPLSAAGDKHAMDDFVSIIQHPHGDFKQIALRENRVLGRGQTGHMLFYGTDTLPGSSGSPVFNDQYDIVALHHAGSPTGHETILDDEQPIPESANEGIRISAIVADLLAYGDSLDADRQALLDAAVTNIGGGASALPGRTPRSVATDSTIGYVATGSTRTHSARAAATPRVVDRVAPDGQQASDTPDLASGLSGLERNKKPNQDYSNREGYDPDFLGVALPMPSLSDEVRQQSARIKGSNQTQLDYWHFSVELHATRRMPIVTAVNIDGPTWKQINRTTRVVTDPFESSETWYIDPRIEADEQSQQSDYDLISEIFDRGHMVRREDPQWGDSSRALEAMDDTFHFTNACPQNWRFNERAAFWQGIENYVLNGMRNAPEKVTVFTGPIFLANDPRFGEFKVPLNFWKVICRITPDDELRSTGFIASQHSVINDPREEALGTREWDIGADEPVAQFQASIGEIEQRTSLTFADLVRDADTHTLGFESGQEADRRPLRRIATPSAASW
jgi:endonuclease G